MHLFDLHILELVQLHFLTIPLTTCHGQISYCSTQRHTFFKINIWFHDKHLPVNFKVISYFGHQLQNLWTDSHQILSVCSSTWRTLYLSWSFRYIHKSNFYGHFKQIRVSPKKSSTSYFYSIWIFDLKAVMAIILKIGKRGVGGVKRFSKVL